MNANGSTLTGNATPTHVPPIPRTISKLPGQDLIPRVTEVRTTTVGTTQGSSLDGVPPQGAMFLQTFPQGDGLVPQPAVSYTYGFNQPPAPLPLKLYAKIHKIIKDGIRVGKNGRNDFHKYDYVTEADVVDEMKRIFTENNMVYDFNIVGTSRVDGLENVTLVEAEITLVDLESGESKIYSFFGQGQDKGDKGIYKAYTGLQKYFFMKNFLISTGDDPENDGGPVKTAPKTTTAAPVKRGFTPPTRQAAPPVAAPTPAPSAPTVAPTPTAADVSAADNVATQSTGATNVAQTSSTASPTTTAQATETPAQAATTESNTPVVKKPRGTFNPPKRTPKPAKEE